MSILQELDHFRIPLKDIQEATNNFDQENFIGVGGYGIVHKGKLLHSKGLLTVVAKQVDPTLSHGENHFLNGIRVLSSYKHTNIVSFIGFCDENNEKILVEEFATHGSLDKYVGSAKLTWVKRLEICLGAARGLNHLHNGHISVLHRDVRSRTILLDENWQAKIGGFGLSIMGLGPMHPTIFVNDMVGALGYVDPRYLQTGVMTKESDVYSFGVVLFEVLCGRLAYEIYDYKQLLGPFARLHYEEGKLTEIIDPNLREQMNPDTLEAFSLIAYQCLYKYPSKRPTMNQIVQKLDQLLGLQQEFEKALALQQSPSSPLHHVPNISMKPPHDALFFVPSPSISSPRTSLLCSMKSPYASCHQQRTGVNRLHLLLQFPSSSHLIHCRFCKLFGVSHHYRPRFTSLGPRQKKAER